MKNMLIKQRNKTETKNNKHNHGKFYSHAGVVNINKFILIFKLRLFSSHLQTLYEFL